MKINNIRTVTLLLVLPVLLASGAMALCKGEHEHTTMEVGQVSEGSIYDLPLSFTDHRGATVKLADLHGPKTVFALFFTRCASICPRIIADMKQIQASLPEADRKEVRFLAISFDDRDDTASLADYASRMQLQQNWSLMSGEAESIQDLAAALGFQYRQLPDGQFAHSTVIYLIDEHGVVRHKKSGGLGQDLGSFVQKVQDL